MIRLVYFSLAREPFDEKALLHLLAKCRANNTECGVSGQLVYSEGVFMQVLEGPEAAVDETFARVQKDTRHHQIRLIERTSIDVRQFPEWSMGFKSMRRSELSKIGGVNYQLEGDAETGRQFGDKVFVTELMKYVKHQYLSDMSRAVLEENDNDQTLMGLLNRFVRYAVMLLAVLMAVVVLFGVADVAWTLYDMMLNSPETLLSFKGITSTFASFLSVLIAIDIFINISLYVRKHMIAVRLVVATALMAVARKIVVLEFSDVTPLSIFAMAAIVVALGISYYYLSKLNPAAN